MFVARLLIGQRLQVFVGLDNNLVHLFGNGQHLLYVIHKAVVLHSLAFVFKRQRRVNIYLVQLHILYAVALIQHPTHLYHRHKGGIIHVYLLLFGVYTELAVLLRPRVGDTEQHKEHGHTKAFHFFYDLCASTKISIFCLNICQLHILFSNFALIYAFFV